MAKNRLLITGCTGFIGSSLAERLDSSDYEILGVARQASSSVQKFETKKVDLASSDATVELIDSFKPDFIVHCASQVKPSRDLNDFDGQIQNTVRPAINLARACPQQIKLIAFLGSCEEYGNGSTPFVEEQAPKVFSPYGWGKIAALEAVRFICEERKLAWTWLRPFLVFGSKRQNHEQLIPSLISAFLKDETLALSPGQQTRDFIFIGDFLGMIEKILREPEAARSQILNLCSGEARTIASVAMCLKKIIAKGNPDFGKIPYRSGEAMSFYGSNKKFTELYGPFKLTDFEEALRLSIKNWT